MGSTWGECEATSTSIIRATTPVASHASTRAWTCAASPETTVVCGEVSTAMDTPSACAASMAAWTSSEPSITEAIAPPEIVASSAARRQMTLTPSAGLSTPATTAAATSPSDCPITAALLHAPGPPQRGQRDLHPEQDGLDAVDARQLLGLLDHLAQREARFRPDQGLQLVDGGGEHRLSRQ